MSTDSGSANTTAGSLRLSPNNRRVYVIGCRCIAITLAAVCLSIGLLRRDRITDEMGHEGTGLGLPLAVRLAELHGGSLVVASVKGRGTTVRVTLPASRIIAAAPRPVAAAASGN
jgi:light-regulated signal transduction histidine kinase (bacteriophytochrome)